MVQRTLTQGGESAILTAADQPGPAVCRSLRCTPPGAPAKDLHRRPEAAMPEIAAQHIST